MEEVQVTGALSIDTVELDLPLPTAPRATWTLNGVPAVVAPLPDPCHAQVCSDLLLAVGQTLKLVTYLTDFEEVELELHKLWDPIWNRHRDVAFSHWDRIIDFGIHFLPEGVCDGPVWTAGTFKQVLCGYKRKVTRGPDSWDREDLLALSEVRCDDIARLYDCVESGSRWPTQVVTGFVCPLPKVDGADTAALYRPIVLVSLLYRLWASASSKCFLPYLSQRASPHIFGYLKGRRTSDLWTLLQVSLEMAHATGQSLTGYCADLVKCFNRLPRHPLLRLLRHLGLAERTVVGWTSALDFLARRFKVHSQVGPSRFSTTGFPEGDPLSCLAMLGFNFVFDSYLKRFAPDCVPLAFVDNLQLIASTAALLQPGILVVQTFMEAWDLTLDPVKSYTWSSNAQQRSVLRAFGHLVRLAGRDLGAQMTYSKLIRKDVFHQRLQSCSHFWTLLRRSSASAWFKKLALRMAAWPKLLHGCENAWIPVSSLGKLRSKCMFALGWDRAGANPLIRWSLLQPTGYDPEFYQLWQTFLSFWRMSRLFPYIREAWSATRHVSELSQGLLYSVELALELLDWVLDGQWNLHVWDQTLHWFSIELETLKLLVLHCWQQSLCQRWEHRKDFQGLPTIDVEVSFRSFKTSNVATAELVSTLQDGTFYTAHCISKFDVACSSVCTFCGVVDDLAHRCVVCPRYDAVRQQHPEAVRRWSQMPRAFNEHALIESNPFLWQHWCNLLHLPDTTHCHFFTPQTGIRYHVFTDGSCWNSSSATKRLAAWAAVVMEANIILAHGVVPGLLQTIDVAEAMGMLSVLRWAVLYQSAVTMHSDSQYAVDGLLFLQQHYYVPDHWKHQILWHQMLELCHQLQPGQLVIHKVNSHGLEEQALDSLEEWLIRGNAKADAAANAAQKLRSDDFMNTYRSLCSHHDRSVGLVTSQVEFLLDVSRFDLENKGSTHHVDTEDLPLSFLVQQTFPNDSNLAAQFELDLLMPSRQTMGSEPFDFEDAAPNDGSLVAQFELEATDLLPAQCPCGFSRDFSAKVLSFLLNLDVSAARCRMVTGIELLAAFGALNMGSIPHPRIVEGVTVYEEPHLVVAGGLVRHTITSAALALRRCIVQLLSHFGVLAQTGQSNRPDLGLFFNVWAIRVGWPDHVEAVSRVVISRWFDSRPARRACDLARPF